jgi:hypothetical protein
MTVKGGVKLFLVWYVIENGARVDVGMGRTTLIKEAIKGMPDPPEARMLHRHIQQLCDKKLIQQDENGFLFPGPDFPGYTYWKLLEDTLEFSRTPMFSRIIGPLLKTDFITGSKVLGYCFSRINDRKIKEAAHKNKNSPDKKFETELAVQLHQILGIDYEIKRLESEQMLIRFIQGQLREFPGEKVAEQLENLTSANDIGLRNWYQRLTTNISMIETLTPLTKKEYQRKTINFIFNHIEK